jgi:hypothetical protein
MVFSSRILLPPASAGGLANASWWHRVVQRLPRASATTRVDAESQLNGIRPVVTRAGEQASRESVVPLVVEGIDLAVEPNQKGIPGMSKA